MRPPPHTVLEPLHPASADHAEDTDVIETHLEFCEDCATWLAELEQFYQLEILAAQQLDATVPLTGEDMFLARVDLAKRSRHLPARNPSSSHGAHIQAWLRPPPEPRWAHALQGSGVLKERRVLPAASSTPEDAVGAPRVLIAPNVLGGELTLARTPDNFVVLEWDGNLTPPVPAVSGTPLTQRTETLSGAGAAWFLPPPDVGDGLIVFTRSDESHTIDLRQTLDTLSETPS